MTPEQLVQSKIKIATPLESYEPDQGDLSNFDWMAYQIKALERILGKEDTAAWLNRPHSQLRDRAPADVSFDGKTDEGCKIIAQLIADLITGAPERLNRCPMAPVQKKIIDELRTKGDLSSRMRSLKVIKKLFEIEFRKTDNPAAGLDVLTETIASICAGINDQAWEVMRERLEQLRDKVPDSKTFQSIDLVFSALTAQRQLLNKIVAEDQSEEEIKYII